MRNYNDIGVGFNINRGLGGIHTMTAKKVKIGVYGSYKKGFHNHEMLGKNAEFKGLSKITGVMYLVTTGKDPFPLFYINSNRKKTMEREYLLELYEVDADDFQKIQTKELREDNLRVELVIGEDTYDTFVTNPKEKKEPDADTYCKAYVKQRYDAWIGGNVTLFALDKKIAEEKLQEMFDDAATALEKADLDDAAAVLRELIPYLTEDKKPPEAVKPIEPPKQVLLLSDTKKVDEAEINLAS